MKIFGIKFLSTWDRYNNLMKIMQDNEQYINKSRMKNLSLKSNQPLKTDSTLGQIIDKQA